MLGFKTVFKKLHVHVELHCVVCINIEPPCSGGALFEQVTHNFVFKMIKLSICNYFKLICSSGNVRRG